MNENFQKFLINFLQTDAQSHDSDNESQHIRSDIQMLGDVLFTETPENINYPKSVPRQQALMAFSNKDICLIFFQGEEVIKKVKVQFAQFQIVEQSENCNKENLDSRDVKSSCLLPKPCTHQSIILTTKSTTIRITSSETEDERRNSIIQEWKHILNPFVIQCNIHDAYQISEQIGEGAQGQVFKGFNKIGEIQRICAIKVIHLQKICYDITLLSQIKNELSLQQMLHQCEGVLKVREIFIDLQYVFIILDYQSEGTILSKMLGETHFEDFQIRFIMTQLLLTVNFIHQMGIVHRDIKLENVLINQVSEKIYDVKIGDFGLACLLLQTGQKLYEKCGSPSYIAPEVLKGDGYRHECDIFSLGSIFFNLLTGAYLVNGTTQSEVLLKNEKFDLAQINDMEIQNPQSKDLLMKMLNPDSTLRITSHDALLHCFFKEDHLLINDLLQENKKILSDQNKSASQLTCQQATYQLNAQTSTARQVGAFTSQLLEQNPLINHQYISANRHEQIQIHQKIQTTLAVRLGVSEQELEIMKLGRLPMKQLPSFGLGAKSVNYFQAIKRMHSKLSVKDE
ncbi:hypothetical protein FGO68_gene12144 [Halteria grandinella]|uniref:Protein kinase domain-containing protein n=1 Tax=Halteria grandinella TaxID=5974 RepID=A0A8J8T5J4_HALGN|nr:hypothetical protein FGO68_gene12144 [Halteria grandinella]